MTDIKPYNAHICEVCGKRKSGPTANRPNHTACSKIKQKMGTFKSKPVTPARQNAMKHGYEFFTNLINGNYKLPTD